MKIIKYGFFVLFFIVSFFLTTQQASAQAGQVWETFVGGGSSGGGSGGGGGTNFPKCADLASSPTNCLKKDFNVVVSGYSGYFPSNNDRIRIYNALWANSQATNWRRLLMRGGQITIFYGNAGGSSATINSIICGRCATLPNISLRYLLTHELGHTLGLRNGQLYQSFDANNLARSDPGCYESNSCGSRSGYFLKSYVLRYYCPSYSSGCVSIYHDNESFAEATANYLTKESVNKTGGWCAKTISDFRNQCHNTYNWMRNNVFNGYDFY